jgi:hypothetical protein
VKRGASQSGKKTLSQKDGPFFVLRQNRPQIDFSLIYNIAYKDEKVKENRWKRIKKRGI